MNYVVGSCNLPMERTEHVSLDTTFNANHYAKQERSFNLKFIEIHESGMKLGELKQSCPAVSTLMPENVKLLNLGIL